MIMKSSQEYLKLSSIGSISNSTWCERRIKSWQVFLICYHYILSPYFRKPVSCFSSLWKKKLWSFKGFWNCIYELYIHFRTIYV